MSGILQDYHYSRQSQCSHFEGNQEIHVIKAMEIPLCIYANKCFMALNIIETFFSKLVCSILRETIVGSKDELKARMSKYIQNLNNEHVVFRWNWKMDEMPSGIIS